MKNLQEKNVEKLPWRAIFLAVLCNVLFGSAFPAIKLGYEFFSVSNSVFSKLLYAGIRFFLSGVVVYLLCLFLERKFVLPKKENVGSVVLLGLTYTFLQYLFFYIGLSNTTGSIGSVVGSSSVFISIVAAHFIYQNDKLTLKRVLGCALGFLGVLLACLESGLSFSLQGEGFIFISAAVFVFGSVINKNATKKDSFFTVTAFNLLIGGLALILVGLLGYNGEMTFTWKGAAVLAYLVFVSSVAFTLWSALLKKYPIGKLSVYAFVMPVSGSVLSALILQENIFKIEYLLALLLVSLGIVIVNKTKNK